MCTKAVMTISTLFMLLISYQSCATKRLPVITDLNNLKYVSQPHLSPDGKNVIYALQETNTKKDTTFSNIWQININAKRSTQLTFTHSLSNSLPKWSPDGKTIAYLSNQTNHITQIWLMQKNGGKAYQLTTCKTDVSDFTWSPDSKKIAYIARDITPNSRNIKPIVIDRYVFKKDYDGYLGQVKHHLYTINLATKKSQMLTSGDYDDWGPSWSPDGQYIAFGSKRGNNPDKHFNNNVYVIQLNNKNRLMQLTHYQGNNMDQSWESELSWSPDSKKIAYLRSGLDKWIYYHPTNLTVIDVTGEHEHIIAEVDKWLSKPQWSNDGKSIIALIEEDRNTYLSDISSSSGQIKYLTQGKRYDYDFTQSKETVVVLSSDDTHPGELYTLNPLKQLTHHNQALLNNVAFQTSEDIQFKNNDGEAINGILMKPAGFEKGKTYPAFLYLHGGPVSQFNHEFDFDMQYLSSKGYAIIAPNPRGSSGRGFSFAKAIYADWGNKDVDDVLAAINHVVDIGIADPARLAVGGWSYGSMLTNYVITHDNRFKAAISGAGTGNILGNYGVDQYALEYDLELGKPWKNTERYLKLSYPFIHADKIKTPTLFMCAENDFNMPCSGSEQLYQALASESVPSRLVIYPKQNHSLTVPSFIIDCLSRYEQWLNQYLNKA